MANGFKSELDRHLAGAAGEILRRLEAALPPRCGLLILMYNRDGETLDLVAATMNGRPDDEQRILRVAEKLFQERGRVAAPPYEPPTPDLRRNVILHAHADELLASYLVHNPGALPSTTSALELIRWAYEQCGGVPK